MKLAITMEGISLMLKLKLLFFSFFTINLFAIEVVITTSNIDFHEIIDSSKLSISEVNEVKKYCTPLKISDFKSNNLVAKRYLKEGTILCTKDIEESSKNKVLFNFGAIEVESPGEIIYENDEFIKIKKLDGKIEKIYKDGRVQ